MDYQKNDKINDKENPLTGEPLGEDRGISDADTFFMKMYTALHYSFAQFYASLKYKKTSSQDGFILPMVMIILLFFVLYTMGAIDHLNDERDFLKERQVTIQIDLQKKICAHDLVSMLSQGTPQTKQGELNYPEGYLTYEITEPEIGIEMVQANLYLGSHHDSFTFLFDENTKRMTKWVD